MSDALTIPPGTAVCLCCEWRAEIRGYSGEEAGQHTRETGHATLSLPATGSGDRSPARAAASRQRAAQAPARPRHTDTGQSALWDGGQ